MLIQGCSTQIFSNLSVRRALMTLVDRWGIICVCLANRKIMRAIITTGVGCEVLADTDHQEASSQYCSFLIKQLRLVYKNDKSEIYHSISPLHQYVSEFKDVFISDDEVLFCQTYGKSIVTQHLSGSKHITAIVDLKYWPDRQSLIGESFASSSCSASSKFATFARNVCKAFVSTDIQHL
jgi:hypothetical protein